MCFGWHFAEIELVLAAAALVQNYTWTSEQPLEKMESVFRVGIELVPRLNTFATRRNHHLCSGEELQ